MMKQILTCCVNEKVLKSPKEMNSEQNYDSFFIMIVNFATLTFKWRVYSKQLQVHLQSQSFYRVT